MMNERFLFSFFNQVLLDERTMNILLTSRLKENGKSLKDVFGGNVM